MSKDASFTTVQKFFFRMARIYYKKIEIEGMEHLPKEGSILVANHYNSLMDAVIVIMSIGHNIRILAKSQILKIPIIGWLARQFRAIPIYRVKDIGRWGGAKSEQEASVRNEETFEQLATHLHGGGSMLLFPEGVTHSSPKLQKLRTGTARIALNAESQSDWKADLKIVPMGLWYEKKHQFRSSVFMNIGKPITLTNFKERYNTDPKEATRELTQRIKQELDALVLQAEQSEILRALPRIACWIKHPRETNELQKLHKLSEKLLETYNTLQQRDPKRLNHIAEALRTYADNLKLMKVTDPWSLELEQKYEKTWRANMWLVMSSPLALVGLALSIIPYKSTEIITKRVVLHHTSRESLTKFLMGIMLFIFNWLALAVVIGLWVSLPMAALSLIATPILHAHALTWIEMYGEYRARNHHKWLRNKKAEEVAHLIAERRELAAEILSAMNWAEQDRPTQII